MLWRPKAGIKRLLVFSFLVFKESLSLLIEKWDVSFISFSRKPFN